MAIPSKQGVSRRTFLAQTSGALIATAITSHAAGESTPRQPNILYIFGDEHRYQSLPFTEMPPLQTPAFVRMASEGVCFTNCISNYPVCSPYRAMLLTSRWPYQTGITDNSLPLRNTEQTLGKTFQQAGYRTGYIGKWHLGGTRAESFGFDASLIWDGGEGHWRSKYHPRRGGPVVYEGYTPTGMTDQAIAFIRQAAQDKKRFMLILSWIPPHAPFQQVSDSKKALYPKGSLPYRPNIPASIQGAEASTENKAVIWEQNDWVDYQGYHAHISAIDDELARLLALLAELGIDDNTLVMYSSDHGSMQGSHSLGGKRQPYEESIRVPLLARWPGRIPAGQKRTPLIGAIDLFPTLCGLAGLTAPDTCMGRDMSNVVFDQNASPQDDTDQFIMHIAKEHASGGKNHPAPLFRGLRTMRHTYARFVNEGGVLFDNQEDPYQMHNQFYDPAWATLRKELDDRLRARLKQAEDPCAFAS